MTIPVETATRYRYEGNGVTTSFAYPTRAYNQSYLVVKILTRTTSEEVEELVLTTDYSVSFNTNGSADVLITNALKIPSITQDILLDIDLPYTQDTDLPSGTPFPSKTVEDSLDKLTSLTRILKDVSDRSIKTTANEIIDESALFLPEATARANKYLAFDGDGDTITTTGTTSSPISVAMEPVVSAATLADGRTELEVDSSSEVDVKVAFPLPAIYGRIGDLGSIDYRNLLINGNFVGNTQAVSGTVTLSADEYGHDGWKGGASGCTYTFAADDADYTINISAGSLIQEVQAADFVGGNVVLSWGGTATAKIGGGTAGTSPVQASATTAATAFSVEVLTGTVGNIQLERGLLQTPFARQPTALSEALAGGYVESRTGNPITLNAIKASTSGAWQSDFVAFRYKKLTVPTVTATGVFRITGTAGSATVTATDITSTVSFAVTTNGFNVVDVGTATTADVRGYYITSFLAISAP